MSIHQKYPTLPNYRIIAELRRLQEIANLTRDLVGKNILDIGCGSKNSKDLPGGLTKLWYRFFDPHVLEQFEPWYCRIAHEARAKIIGLDIEPNNESFETFQVDLLEQNAFEQFDDESFDAVNNYKCTIPRNSRQAHMACSPAIMKRYDMNFERAFELDDAVRRQVERLLKPRGIYTVAEFVYRKEKGGLKLTRVMDGLGS